MITRSNGSGSAVKAMPAGEEVELVIGKIVYLGVGQFGESYVAKLANSKGEEAAFFFSPKLTKPGSDRVSNLSRLEQKAGVTLPDSLEESHLGQLLVGAQVRGDITVKKNAKGYDSARVTALYKASKEQKVSLPSWSSKTVENASKQQSNQATSPAATREAALQIQDSDIPF